MLDAYRDAGGRGPIVLQVHLSYAATDDEALAIAVDQWRGNCVPTLLAWDLTQPEQFEAATRHVPGHRGRRATCVSPRTRRGTRDGSGATSTSASTSCSCTTSDRDNDSFIERFRHVRSCPRCGVPHEGDVKPATCGGRPPSSTAWTCRPSTTRNGDGIGDFAGLAERLDHLVDLGVTVVWLMPFYPTADVDDGYDITDFYTVDPRLGTLGDFVEFIRIAPARAACG